MGLDTTHDCFNGSYSGFHDFRRALAHAIGIKLEEMVGFESIGGGHIPANQIRWEGLPADPLHTLLNHSDCEGTIERDDQLPLAARLEEVAELIGHPLEPSYNRQRALRFAAGLRQAHAANEMVEFY